MRIRIIRFHSEYGFGEHDVEEARGNYLIRVGAAKKVEYSVLRDDLEPLQEKVEIEPGKEKAETQPGNVPTARGRKKK